MEKQSIEKPKIMPQNVDDAVRLFMDGNLNEGDIINYLRSNRDDITEFCLQVYESYQEGDKAGIIKISMLLDKAL